MIEEITAYRTKDGRVFKTRTKAEAHEDSLAKDEKFAKVMEWLESIAMPPQNLGFVYTKMAKRITANLEEFKSTFKDL